MRARAYLSLFRIKLTEGVQYRAAGLAGAATSIFWALIEITVYTVFYTHGDRAALAGTAALTLPQAVSYVWLGQFFFLIQPMAVEPELREKINNGDVGLELCRPLDLHAHWLARVAAGRAAPLVWRGIPILLAGMLLPAGWGLGGPSSLPGFLLMLLSAGAAFLLCAAFGTLICVLRLQVAWGDGPVYMLALAASVLSGCYLPLQLWPDFLQPFLLLQPFAGYLDIPLRVYLGTMAPADAVFGIALQLLWSGIFLLTGRLFLRKRLKSLVVQGG